MSKPLENRHTHLKNIRTKIVNPGFYTGNFPRDPGSLKNPGKLCNSSLEP